MGASADEMRRMMSSDDDFVGWPKTTPIRIPRGGSFGAISEEFRSQSPTLELVTPIKLTVSLCHRLSYRYDTLYYIVLLSALCSIQLQRHFKVDWCLT